MNRLAVARESRLLHAVLFTVAAAVIIVAVSPDAMRWFLRFPLLLAGVGIGTWVLHVGGKTAPAIEGLGTRSLRWGGSALLLVLACAAAGLGLRFLRRDALHYFDFHEASFGSLWPRRFWLIAHISGGMSALLLGPVQFWTGTRATGWRAHRWIGRGYVLAVLLAACSAFHLAPFIAPAEGGLVSGVSMMILAAAWLTATGLSIRAILNRRIEAHREWMIRSYVLACAFVSIRWQLGLPGIVALGPPEQRIPMIIWAAWAVPLFVTEAVFEWRRTAREPVQTAA